MRPRHRDASGKTTPAAILFAAALLAAAAVAVAPAVRAQVVPAAPDAPQQAAEAPRPANDYPTAARADYVIGCLAANGFRRELLERCACGIDTIADMMTYADYEKAETIMRMQQGALGQRGAIFRDTPIAREETEKLRRAQAEVNLRCR